MLPQIPLSAAAMMQVNNSAPDTRGGLMSREKNPESTPTPKRAPRRKAAAAAAPVVQPPFVDPQQRAALIARAAYFRAMQRGFGPGHEMADWLAAEAEVDAELLQGATRPTSG
jgi:hypothetical protein